MKPPCTIPHYCWRRWVNGAYAVYRIEVGGTMVFERDFETEKEANDFIKQERERWASQ